MQRYGNLGPLLNIVISLLNITWIWKQYKQNESLNKKKKH